LPADALVAQWASAAYGRRQHGAYARFVVAGTVTIVAAAVVVGGATRMSLTDWLIVFLLPVLPALLDVTDPAQAHQRLAIDKRDIEARINSLWRNELDQPGLLTGDDCHEVQDGLFRLRIRGLQIPDWYYRLQRDRNEANMTDAAASRRSQYEAATPP
jgi:hypothetical protein